MDRILQRSDTAVPSEHDMKLAAAASRALACVSKEHLTVRLGGGDELVLPQAATQLLFQLLMEMGQGNAVTVIPIHAELTTQQAADYLGVSRPYLVTLLEQGKIPYHKVGTHRRVRFSDICAQKLEFEKVRRAALDELAAQAQAEGMGY